MTVETEYRPSEADIKPFRRNEIKYRALRWIVKRLPANIEVRGLENVQRTRELLEEDQLVTALGNHKGIGDTYDIFSAAIQYDFEDLTKETYFSMSVKYTKGLQRLLLNGVVNYVEIVPHTVSEYPNKEKINAIAKFRQQHRKPGTIWEVMPEGTRVEGKMQKARWGASAYWHGEEGSTENRWILFAAVQGTEDQLPKGSGIWGVIRFLKENRQIPARFIFGEPVKVEYIDRAAQYYSDGNPDKLRTLSVDLVMLLVTRLQLANDGKRYVSEENLELIEELENHPFSQALNKLGYFGFSEEQIAEKS